MKKASFVGVLLLSACASLGERKGLDEALFEYTHGMRWSRYDYVAAYLPTRLRGDFLRKAADSGALRVTRCAVTGMRKVGREVEVVVVLDWYWVHQGRVRTTRIAQRWRRVEEQGWKVARQRLLSGAALPLLMPPSGPRSGAS